MGSLSYNNSNSKKEQQRSSQFISAKLQLCMCLTLFCTFLSHPCKSVTWNFLISLARFMELVSTAQHCLFLFSKPDTFLSGSTPDNFAKILQIKWNCVTSMKFETVQIDFVSDVFGLLSSRKFATMATWRNNFSSLLRILALVSRKKFLFHKNIILHTLSCTCWNATLGHHYLFCGYLPVIQVALLK